MSGFFMRVNISTAAVLLALIGSLSVAGCTKHDESGEQQVQRPVETMHLHYKPHAQAKTFAATIRPRVETDQGFRVSGKVSERLVEVGAEVTKGTVLARLDVADLKLQLAQAIAETKSAKRYMDQTAGDEQRAATLKKAGWMAQSNVDKLEAAAEEARGRYSRSLSALELADNNVNYAELKAEADGVVTAVAIEPGQVVAAGQPAIRLARRGEKEAVVNAPEQYLDLFRNGKAEITLWSQPDRRLEAQLRELSPIADAVTRTYAAKFTLPPTEKSLVLGMSATLTLTPSSKGLVAEVPLTALMSQNNDVSVYVVGESGHIKRVPVVVESYGRTSAFLRSGPPEDAQIVTLGVQKLDEGLTVRPISDMGF